MVWEECVWVVLPEPHIGITKQSLQQRGRNVRCLVPRSQEERHDRNDHLIGKLLAKPEQLHYHLDGQEPQNRKQTLDPFEHASQLLDLARQLVNQRGGKYIREEILHALAERDLQFHRARLVAVPTEEVEGVPEDRRATLHAIVEPVGAVAGLVKRDGGCLAAGARGNIEEGHVEAIGVLGQSRGTGLFIQSFNWVLDSSTWGTNGLPCLRALRQQ